MWHSLLSNVHADSCESRSSHFTPTLRLVYIFVGALAVAGCNSRIAPPSQRAITDHERFSEVVLQFDHRPVQSEDVSVVAKQPVQIDISFGVAPQYALPNPKESVPQRFPGTVSVLFLADGGRSGELIKFRANLGGKYGHGKGVYSGLIVPKVPLGLYEFRVVCEPDQVPAPVPAVHYTIASTLVRIE